VIIDVSKLPKPSVYRALKTLHENGYVWVKAQRYGLTPSGLTEIVSQSPSPSHLSLTVSQGSVSRRVSSVSGGILIPPTETPALPMAVNQ
jgi:hypothetical protein